MIFESNIEITDNSTSDEDIFDIAPLFDSEFNPIRNSGILKKVSPQIKSKYGISNIASMTFYVHHDVLIDDLVTELDKHSKLLAVGVVDDNEEVTGIIIRREIFNLLARSYGDDFSMNRTVASVAANVKIFHYSINAFTVADIIEDDLMSSHMQYYLLVNTDNQFCGIFSTRDLLVYLAQMSKRDLDTATRLQNRIINDKMYESRKNLEISAAAVMAKGVGGDFYSIKNPAGPHWFINIADVSGKGISASFITSILSALTETYDFRKGIKKFILKLNEYIYETFNTEKFLTGVFTMFNEEDGTLRLFDMGHSFIYIYRNNKIHTLKTSDTNIPIGISPEINPESKKVQLLPGDIVIMTTDGIIEQMNDVRELYGIDKFSEIIRENHDSTLEELREIILHDLDKFRGIEPQHDDTTFILFKYKP